MTKRLYIRLSSVVLFALLLAAGLDAQVDMQPGAQSGDLGAQSAGAPSASISVAPTDIEKLKIAPGFVLGLKVLDDPDFTGSFRVDDQGEITIPILGTVHVSGRTASNMRLEIQKKLIEQKILLNPQVELSIVQYVPPKVSIIGEVKTPGKYQLLAPQSLVSVIAMAGGLTPLAGDKVRVTSGGSKAETRTIRFSRETPADTVDSEMIKPGETIDVVSAGVVYVLGAVNRPGGYVMQEGGTLTLLQAISLAYGTSTVAATSKIYLLQKTDNGTKVEMTLPYNKIARGKMADVALRDKDVIYVPNSKMKAVFANTQSIWSAAASATVYRY